MEKDSREYVTLLDEIRRALYECKVLDDLKRQYKKLVLKWHPDRTDWDTTKIMQEINEIYDKMVQNITKNSGFSEKKTQSVKDEAEYFKYFINKFGDLEDITIEICGWYIWVSGDTKKYKDIFNAEKNMWYAPKKGEWYYKPEWMKSRNRKEWDKDKIRKTYGSETIRPKKKTKIEEPEKVH